MTYDDFIHGGTICLWYPRRTRELSAYTPLRAGSPKFRLHVHLWAQLIHEISESNDGSNDDDVIWTGL